MSLDNDTPRAADTLGAPVDLDAEFSTFLGDLNEELAALDVQASDAPGHDGDASTETTQESGLPTETDDLEEMGPEMALIPTNKEGVIIAGDNPSTDTDDVPWNDGPHDITDDLDGADTELPTLLGEGDDETPMAGLDEGEDLPGMLALDTGDDDFSDDFGTALPGLDLGEQLDVDPARLESSMGGAFPEDDAPLDEFTDDASALASFGADDDDFGDDLPAPGSAAAAGLGDDFAPSLPLGFDDDDLAYGGDSGDLSADDLPAPGSGAAAAALRPGDRFLLPSDDELANNPAPEEPPSMLADLAGEGDEPDAADLSDPLQDIPEIDASAFNPFMGEGVEAEEGDVDTERPDADSLDELDTDAGGFDAFADEGADIHAGENDADDYSAGIDETFAASEDTLSLDAPLEESAGEGEEVVEEEGTPKPNKKGQYIFFAVAAIVIAAIGAVVIGALSPSKPSSAPTQAQAMQPRPADQAAAFAPEAAAPAPEQTVAPAPDVAAAPAPEPTAAAPAPMFAPTPVDALAGAPAAAPVSTEPATVVHANPPEPAPAPVALSRSVDLNPKVATTDAPAVEPTTAPAPTLEEVRQDVASALNTTPPSNEQLTKVLDRLKVLEAQQKEILLNMRRANQQHIEATRNTSRAAKASATAPRTTRTPSVTYELMGAATGKAVVRSSSDGKTRVVSVGQALEGLGRVTRIEAHGCLYHERGVLTTRSASCK